MHKQHEPLPIIYSDTFCSLVDELLEKKPDKRLNIASALQKIPYDVKKEYNIKGSDIKMKQINNVEDLFDNLGIFISNNGMPKVMTLSK